MLESTGPSARTSSDSFVISPTADLAGLTLQPRLSMTECASRPEVHSKSFSQFLILQPAAMVLHASATVAMVAKLRPPSLGSREPVLSLVVHLTRVNTAMTTPCKDVLIMSLLKV